MKIRTLLLLVFPLIVASCIRIENIPEVTVTPTVEITTHIANGKLNATIRLNSATSIVVAGNVPINYYYLGSASIIDAKTGDQLANTVIDDDGIVQIFSISADTAGINDFIISATGELSVHAGDKDKTFLTSSPFYGESQITFSFEELPQLSLNPSIVINSSIIGKELIATVTINANPAIQVQGSVPIIYQFQGDVKLIDGGNPNNQATIDFEDKGSIEVNRILEVKRDTSNVDRYIIKVSGWVAAFGDTNKTGNASNNPYLTSVLFYAENEVIINSE